MKFRQLFVLAVQLAGLLLFAPCASFAEEPAQDGQALDQAANDPTASLMSVQIQDIYAGNYHNLNDESGNTILLRSAVPFKTGRLNHIARATLPIVTDSPSGKSGLSDLVLFDLIVFNESWGRWGSGRSCCSRPRRAMQLGAEQWAVGPAGGVRGAEPETAVGRFQPEPFYLCRKQ